MSICWELEQEANRGVVPCGQTLRLSLSSLNGPRLHLHLQTLPVCLVRPSNLSACIEPRGGSGARIIEACVKIAAARQSAATFVCTWCPSVDGSGLVDRRLLPTGLGISLTAARFDPEPYKGRHDISMADNTGPHSAGNGSNKELDLAVLALGQRLVVYSGVAQGAKPGSESL